jgi:hypothetical protein
MICKISVDQTQKIYTPGGEACGRGLDGVEAPFSGCAAGGKSSASTWDHLPPIDPARKQ